MLKEIPYNRAAVFDYAKEWAFERNPAYLNFDGLGGDCTNFASQCVFAGCGVMNYRPVFGWYYRTASDRTPSWTGVQYLYNFLLGNSGEGAFGTLIPKNAIKTGDLIQLGNASGVYYHTLVAVGNSGSDILVAAHTFDAFLRPLSSYNYAVSRFIRIGARKNLP